MISLDSDVHRRYTRPTCSTVCLTAGDPSGLYTSGPMLDMNLCDLAMVSTFHLLARLQSQVTARAILSDFRPNGSTLWRMKILVKCLFVASLHPGPAHTPETWKLRNIGPHQASSCLYSLFGNTVVRCRAHDRDFPSKRCPKAYPRKCDEMCWGIIDGWCLASKGAR
jgi:hypothetical protein